MLFKPFVLLAIIYISGLNYQCEGCFLIAGTAAVTAVAVKKNHDRKAASISFKLWTRRNLDAEIVVFKKRKMPRFQYFSPLRKTIILIHGRVESEARLYVHEYFQVLASAYLVTGDYNIIGVDWVKLSMTKSENLSIKNAIFVGKHTSIFLKMLTKLSVSARAGFEIVNHFEIVAHQYGSIAASVIGAKMKNKFIYKITALAPPRVGLKVPPFYQLSKKHAFVVHVIHTYGEKNNRGHYNIYINGGRGMQPGCLNDDKGACSIRKVYHYFAIDVLLKGRYYEATLCDSYNEFLNGRCDNNAKISLYHRETPRTRPEGNYYIQTEEVPHRLFKLLKIVI